MILQEDIQNNLLKIGSNCWRAETATHAAMVVDCANYYRALHDSICKAKHSIFILGWDIDSRIELLRGKDAEKSECPAAFFDLIQWKARQNPDIKIYLNRWEFSLVFANQREAGSNLKWRLHSPCNVFYSFDDQLPVSACHHQKVIVIDDEIAFCGGMDVAIARWDHREHVPEEEFRSDPAGMNSLIRKIPFGPYHDVMCIVSGSAAQAMAEWCRERWRRAAGFEPVPLRPQDYKTLPPSWPKNIGIDFRNIETGIAMTLPPSYGEPAIREIEQLYLDMIQGAENFIYIENQYLAYLPVAQALNQRLREKPHLRVLIASCYQSNGIIERKSMWTGRIKFREILESGDVTARVAIAYPVSGPSGKERDVRIHSKLMVVDDKYLRVGSSNINNRSMGMDTECDLVFVAHDHDSRNKIAAIRNDLINEHTGRDMESIEKLIRRETDIGSFLNHIASSNQHLRKINDEHYRFERFTKISRLIGDPLRPQIPPGWTMTYCYAGTRRNLPRRLLFAALLIFILMLVALAGQAPFLENYAAPEHLASFLDSIRNAPKAIPVSLATFICGAVFMPVTVVIIGIALIWGPIQGFILTLAGITLSMTLGYTAGYAFGRRPLRVFVGLTAERLDQFVRRAGLAGLIFARMVPLAPSNVINMALGISRVPYFNYLVGSLVGMLPRILALIFVGDALSHLWREPTRASISYVFASVVAWFLILSGSHFLVRYWQKKSFPRGYV